MRAAVLLLVLLAPSAAACSLAGPAPGPGELRIVPLEGGGEPWRVLVEGRMLGAMCELSNAHALDGDAFAWVEVRHLVQGAPRDVIVEWRDGARIAHRDVTRHSIDAFSMWDGSILLYGRAWAEVGEGDLRTFARMDARTGELEDLPFPRGDWSSVAARGSVIAAVRRDEGAERGFLHAYDAAKRAWLLQDLDVATLGLPWHTGIRAVSEGHALIAGQPDVLVDLHTGEARPTPAPSDWVLGLDDGWLYVQTAAGIDRVAVGDGAREPLQPVNGTVVSVQQGHLVLGRYSAGESFGDRARSWLAGAAVAAGLSVTLGWAGTAWWRRSRRGPP